MIVQPHDLIFIGPIGDKGAVDQYQINLNIAMGLNLDEVLGQFEGNEIPVYFTIKYTESENYSATEITSLEQDENPKLLKVKCGMDNLYQDFYNSTDNTFLYKSEFTNDGNPIYYDIVCTLQGIPYTVDAGETIYKEATLELPIYERYNDINDDKNEVGDAIKFTLIYGWKEVTDTITTFTDPSYFTIDNIKILTSTDDFWWTDKKLFGVISSRIDTNGDTLSYEDVTNHYYTFIYSYNVSTNSTKNDKVYHIEHIQSTVQSQWMSGFIVRNWFENFITLRGTSSSPEYGEYEWEPIKDKAYFTTMIVNPHAIGPVSTEDGTTLDYDYALVYYTSPFIVDGRSDGKTDNYYPYDHNYMNLYVADKYKGIRPIGKIEYKDDMYYVVPLTKDQVLLTSNGIMVSMIKYIKTK